MSNNKINLPKTAFSMKAGLAHKEPQTVKKWEDQNIYNKVLEKNKGNQPFILHDGPPYANGHIHLGHALNKVLKDIILKYEAMNGKYTPYIPGWDCHGLPIEYQLLKEMDTDKNNVDQLKFRQKAAKFALKHVKIQKEEFKRLGILAEWENSYLTLLSEYEGNIIRVFKELALKGYIYRGLKPVYWCSSCETALAEFEVEHQEHTSTSVFLKFPLDENYAEFESAKIPNSFLRSWFNTGSKNTKVSILIWTTTPWTLPSNVAVAFNPEIDYACYQVKTTENPSIDLGEVFIFAGNLKEKIAEELSVTFDDGSNHSKGYQFENIHCFSPYRNEVSLGLLADYVTADDGTGIVHIAPGHGADDYFACLEYNNKKEKNGYKKLPIIAPINSKGEFTSEVEFTDIIGKQVGEANPLIVKNLTERKLLLKVKNIEHSYPHCWRCSNPVIFRATSQWFLKVDHEGLRENILNICKDVNWLPEYGFKRITSMIENRPDWCLSRQRLWGTPIPAFYCEDCGKLLLTNESISSIEEIFRERGSDSWFYLTSKQLLPDFIQCECGSRNFSKETDILDVWFDSGISHEAVLKEDEKLSWPADLYLEGSDQHRGWFQSSLIPAAALYGKAPYKNVLTHGFTVDGDGKKMSKSQGNVVSPHDIISTLGADVLRLWIASENYKYDMPISDEIIKQMTDAYRKIRNTVRYILGNLDGFDVEKDEVEYHELLDLDKWALNSLTILIEKLKTAYENREFHIVYREFYNFCTIELSSRYFDILKDRLYIYAPKSVERCSAQTVLYYLAEFLTKFIAPIIPFTAEEIWQNFSAPNSNLSILLQDMPVPKIEWKFSRELMEEWANIFQFRSYILKEIDKKRLKGVVGNSLEAKVTVKLEKEKPDMNLNLSKQSEDFWSKIAIVSQFEIRLALEGSDAVANLIDSSSYDFCHQLEVEAAKGSKCKRCWNYVEDIMAEFCPRCMNILNNWEKPDIR
ncbi:MAG: isoleucine--tRNA ligase [bacterium]|nr:isoleucine--tRNA ligase [bacterium]